MLDRRQFQLLRAWHETCSTAPMMLEEQRRSDETDWTPVARSAASSLEPVGIRALMVGTLRVKLDVRGRLELILRLLADHTAS
jgi:hypothetical protein